jgi:integrase
MAGIRRRATTWQVRWQQDGQRQTETFADRTSAERFCDRVGEAGNRWPVDWVRGKGFVEGAGSVPTGAGSGHTVASLVAWWVQSDHSKMKLRSRGTVERRMRQRLPLAGFGDKPIASVTREVVQEWVDALSEKYAANTVDASLIPVNAAFRVASRKGWISGASPVYNIRNNGRKPRKPVFMSEQEEARLVAAMDERYRLWLRFMLASGLRYGESWALFPDDVTISASGVVSVKVEFSRNDEGEGESSLDDTKGGKGRTVALPADVGRDIAALAETRDPAAPLFDLPNSGTALTNNHWRKACEAARLVGKRKPTIHDTRHTHASRMLANGMPLSLLSKRLGHASIKITSDTYGHLEPEDAAMMQILANVYDNERPKLRAV